MKPIDETLQQELLEYAYDLLEGDAAARMTERIKSEPEVARAYSEVKQQSERLAEAARLHGPPLLLSKLDDAAENAKSQPDAVDRHSGGSPSETGSGVNASTAVKWVIGLAAALLVAFVGWHYFSPTSPIQRIAAGDDAQVIAAKHLRLVVTGPDRFDPEIPTTLSVSTTTIDRRPLAAEVRYAIYRPNSSEPAYESEPISTDDNGRLTLPVPPQQLLAGDRLELMAERSDAKASMTTRVEVDEIRYATQLTTDKPMYRPGETVYFRSLTLTRFGLASDRELPVRFHLRDPSGGIAPGSESSGYTQRGVASGQYTVPSHLPGGRYALVVESQTDEPDFPAQEREISVRRYRLPRLKKLLEFTRDSYAPGDVVLADFSAERAEGGSAGNARLFVTATVDGETVFTAQTTSGSDGTDRVEFTLPREIENGQGTLSVVVDDGGNRETIAKTIPINLGKVEIKFYPEGGDLVAGLENRVYFYAYDPLGEPVHIETGRILNSNGEEVARLSTYHEGRGRFRFTPAAGESYRLEITEPADVTIDGTLPQATKSPGIVMNTGDGVFAANKAVELDLLAAKANRPLVITAVCRGTQVAQQEFLTSVVRSTGKDDSLSRISLPLPVEASGVIRLTVYDYGVSPPRAIAERLVYRRPHRRLSVNLESANEKYSPGEKVQLVLRVTDETGRPRPAALGLSIVDDALLSLADDRSPTMPTFYYLASEIESPEELEDANFYLLEEKQNDKTPARALDLLLGTQGWRRFVQTGVADHNVTANRQGPTARAETGLTEDAVANAEAIDNLIAMEGVTDFPTLHDNLKTAQTEYENDVAAHYESKQASIAWAGQIAFFGGLALLIALAVVGILRLIRETWFWIPATCGAALSLVIGGLWMNAEIDTAGKLTLIPFTQYENAVALGDGGDGMIDDVSEATESPSEEAGADASDEAEPEADPFGAPDDPGDTPLDDDNDEEAEEDDAPFAEANPVPVADDAFAVDDLDLEVAPGEPFGDFEMDEVRAVFDPLGEVGEALREDLERFGNNDFPGGDELAERPLADAEGGFYYLQRYQGNVNDVAIMRQNWLAASRGGNERVALAYAKAYSELLKKYQLPIRQYAHQHQPGEPGIRTDFAETLYWQPLLIADRSGRAMIEFDLSDTVTTFRVQADAHGSGRIGAGGGEIVSRIPFSLEPKLPLVVTAGDVIQLPLAINNDTDGELPVEINFNQQGELLTLDGDEVRALNLSANTRSRDFFPLTVTGQVGTATLTFTGTAGNLMDGVSKTIEVMPPGFPVSESYSGQIDGDQELTIQLPDDWVEGSLEIKLSAFPSTLADLQKGMEGMLRDPNGCFEQTSSSNYPNVLALNYMEEHDVSDPNFTKRAKELLGKGYQMLISFECKEAKERKGFEWFGQWPAHEALTAYGLMEFRDMSHVWDVDQEMVDRTAQWLMSRRDGQGGFKRNSRALDSFGGAPDDITNAYIVWALSEAKQPGIETELEHTIEVAEGSEDPYLLALAAASAINAGREEQGQSLLKQLTEYQNEDGHLQAKEATITRSGGVSLKIETTALAALAWFKDPGSLAQANKAIEWITNRREGSGGFGNTQATILALKALIEHSKANRRTTSAGELVVLRDGEEIGRQAFAAGETGAVTLEGLAAMVTPGENQLTIKLTGDNQMPYALDVSYRTHKPVSDEGCPLQLAVTSAKEVVTAGETTSLNVNLQNISGEGQPMTLAVIGLPAGLEARVEHLEELREAGTFDYYEVQGREVVFYWRSLSPDAVGDNAIGFDFDVVAEIPGRYTGPASRAYLYYTDELKHWGEPVAITIEK